MATPSSPEQPNWIASFGESSAAAARVYVQADLPETLQECRLAGELHGPSCLYARTLPASATLIQRQGGTRPLAETVIPDPCCWTPGMPYLYRVRVRCERAGKTVWSAERLIGIRPLGARGHRFYFQAKNWVVRGAVVAAAPDFDWDVCREHDLALVIDDPAEEVCAEASRRGVFMIANVVKTPVDEMTNRVKLWQPHAAVGMILLDAGATRSRHVREIARNLLWVARLSGVETPIPDWADAVCCEAKVASSVAAGVGIPTIASRHEGELTIERARVACDALQSDLAGLGEFAGYIV